MSGEHSPSWSDRRRRLIEAFGPFLGLLVVIVFFAVTERAKTGEGNFLGVKNARVIAVQTCTVAVAALGMTLVVIAGGIDLSVGSAVALSATTLAYVLDEGHAWPLALACGLGAGLLAGLINGLLVSTLRIVPFIVTLGTMTVYLGAAKIVAKETTIRPSNESIPEWLQDMVSPQGRLFDLRADWQGDFLRGLMDLLSAPAGVWIALVLAVAVSTLLRFSVFGRHVFALGSNEATARLCGIGVWRTKVIVYALCGLFVGIAGVFQFARLSVGNPTSGAGLELKIIAAVVIGGGSLSGGRGSILGTLAGAALIRVIESGCTMLEIGNPTQDIVVGAIIVAAVALDQFRRRSSSGDAQA